MKGADRNIGVMILYHVWWYLRMFHAESPNREMAIQIVIQKLYELGER